MLSHVSLTALLTTNGDADFCIKMRTRDSLTSADPVDLGAQSDLICAPRLVTVREPSAAPNQAARRAFSSRLSHHSV